MASFTDDFNRADSTNLGAGWVEVSGDWSIVANQLSSGSAGGTVILRAAGAMATNDNSVQVTIAATAAVSHGIWCRGNSNISQGYLWRNDGTSWNLFSVVGGSFVSIGSYAAAAVAGDVAKVQAVGSTIKCYVNGVERVSVTNTAVTTGTSVGLRAESTSSLRFDDFTGADVVTGATGDAAFSGAATLSASGLRATAGNTALTSTASLAAQGVRATASAASLNSTASLTTDGTRTTSGAAGLAASATLAADGTVAHTGDAALTTTAGLAASGQRATSGDAALATAATLSADGQYGANATAGLTATAALTTQGQVAHSSDTALTATATLTADGITGTPSTAGSAALSAAATLAAAGTTAATDNAALAATVTLTAAGTTISTIDDIDITVGTPCSPWVAGQPFVPSWTVQTPQAIDWEVGAPC
jgi:hypothetical protein